MEDSFILTASGRFHAKVQGTGQPALLLHGRDPAFNSWRTWEKNIESLARRVRVYALDLLGYGDSDQPQPRPDSAGQAEALVELIEVEKLSRVKLVGLSWGGRIAQRVIELVPDQVDRLVLVDSGYDDGPEGMRRLQAIRCPTLVIWDEDDAVIPVAHAHTLADAIPGAQLRILARAERDPDADPSQRHWSQVSHSKLWNRIVGEFLAQ